MPFRSFSFAITFAYEICKGITLFLNVPRSIWKKSTGVFVHPKWLISVHRLLPSFNFSNKCHRHSTIQHSSPRWHLGGRMSYIVQGRPNIILLGQSRFAYLEPYLFDLENQAIDWVSTASYLLFKTPELGIGMGCSKANEGSQNDIKGLHIESKYWNRGD